MWPGVSSEKMHPSAGNHTAGGRTGQAREKRNGITTEDTECTKKAGEMLQLLLRACHACGVVSVFSVVDLLFSHRQNQRLGFPQEERLASDSPVSGKQRLHEAKDCDFRLPVPGCFFLITHPPPDCRISPTGTFLCPRKQQPPWKALPSPGMKAARRRG